MRKFFLFISICLNLLTGAAFACDVEQVQLGKKRVWLGQQAVNDGFQELVIKLNVGHGEDKTTRLSFAGSKQAGCHFPSFALIKGGDWGWHVVWTSSANHGVFYARVDGEAWVSSLPKKLSQAVAEQVTLKEMQGKLIITAKYRANLNLPDENFISDDEGRNWDLAPIK